MMILAVDIGNASISLGLFDEADEVCCPALPQPRYRFRLSSADKKSDDEYAVVMKSIFHNNIQLTDIDGVMISSVVPHISIAVTSAIGLLFSCSVLTVEPGIKTSLDIKIDNPAQLGADIVANSVAAAAGYPLPALIMDYGTASTISLLDNNSVFRGSIIMPGLRMSMDALSSTAALLPFTALDVPTALLGRNSAESMLSGILRGAAVQTDGFINQIIAERKIEKISLIATGGLAKYVLPLCTHTIEYEQNLTLIGLYLLYKMNTGAGKR